MPEIILPDYFYGDESEQFLYLKISRLLITVRNSGTFPPMPSCSIVCCWILPSGLDSNKQSRGVYASTGEECEAKLAELIRQTNAEVAEAKQLAATGRWEEAMALAGQKKARGTRNVEGDYQEKSITL